ncbi:MAG: hypothetical protein AAGF49_14040, partial [Pseudomonadota bacterium]
TASSWFSPRLEQDIQLVRWGHWGQPVLVFPTAGGDAEEIERMQLIAALAPLLEAGRIKVYSCDSLAGRALAARWGSEGERCALLNRFEEFVALEAVPAIRADCRSEGLELIAAGASIGAFKATAVVCRYPWLFRAAIGMSGTYDLERLLGFSGTADFYFASPKCFLPSLEGPLLETLRKRFILLAYGEGRWENPDEAWGFERILGGKGVPNRVDVWGPQWDHDWVTWRKMLPLYLDELVP